jgi:hypothetical protein
LYCAGGAESMSFIPMGGYKPTPDYAVAKAGNEDYYWEILHICWLKLRWLPHRKPLHCNKFRQQLHTLKSKGTAKL